MIRGMVNSRLEPTIRVLARGPEKQEEEIEPVIDTGFNGFLTLSPALVRRLGLPRLGQTRVLLADGQQAIVDQYEVTLLWDGQWRTVEADATDTGALVGMSLFRGHSIYMEVVADGHVKIEVLS